MEFLAPKVKSSAQTVVGKFFVRGDVWVFGDLGYSAEEICKH